MGEFDKQIIIDGVDVSGCEFYNKDDKTCREANGKYNIDICDFDKCENSNCYYKQLKRAEQECEFSNLRIIQLQETLSQYETDLSTTDCIAETLKAQNKELKVENETLKQYKSSKQASYESMQREWNQAVNENRELKAENEALKSFNINLVGIKECEIRQFVQYRKTLTEIKEIAEELRDECEYSFFASCAKKAKNQILQKISEVEDETC